MWSICSHAPVVGEHPDWIFVAHRVAGGAITIDIDIDIDIAN